MKADAHVLAPGRNFHRRLLFARWQVITIDADCAICQTRYLDHFVDWLFSLPSLSCSVLCRQRDKLSPTLELRVQGSTRRAGLALYTS